MSGRSAAVDGAEVASGGDMLQLHLWRKLDWRFLLPTLEVSGVGYFADHDPRLEEALRLLDPDVTRLDREPRPGQQLDLVVIPASAEADLARALSAVRPGGWLCVECRRGRGPGLARRSLASTRRFLHRAGLAGVRTFWHPPSLAESTRILGTDDSGAVRATLARHDRVRFGWLKSLIGRAALRLGLFGVVVPEGTVVARRPLSGPADGRLADVPLVDRLLAENRSSLGLAGEGLDGGWETILLTPRFATSRHVVALIHPRGEVDPVVVVKIPRQPGDNAAVAREADILRRLGAFGVDHVPRLLGLLRTGQHEVLVETAVRGPALDPERAAADLPGAVAAGIRFIESLPITRAADPDWYGRLVVQPVDRLLRLTTLGGELADLSRRTHALLQRVRSRPLSAVFEHGDLSHPNLIMDDGSLSVIDWERSDAEGLPGRDLVFFLQYLAESVAGAYTRESQLDAFDDLFGAGGWGTEIVRTHLVRRGIDPGLLPQLIVAGWARSAATLADRLTAGSGQAVDSIVADDRDVWLWRHAVRRAEAAALGAEDQDRIAS